MGKHGTTARARVADIVAAAGVSNDTFYRHFSSKDALVVALLEDGTERLASYIAHQMGKESTPERKVQPLGRGGVVADPRGGRLNDAGRALEREQHRYRRARPVATTRAFPSAALLHEPFAALGEHDPRDGRVPRGPRHPRQGGGLPVGRAAAHPRGAPSTSPSSASRSPGRAPRRDGLTVSAERAVGNGAPVVLVETLEEVMVVTLNRPEARNALSRAVTLRPVGCGGGCRGGPRRGRRDPDREPIRPSVPVSTSRRSPASRRPRAAPGARRGAGARHERAVPVPSPSSTSRSSAPSTASR